MGRVGVASAPDSSHDGDNSDNCMSGGGGVLRRSSEGVIGWDIGVVNMDPDPREADSGSDMIEAALDDCLEDAN